MEKVKGYEYTKPGNRMYICPECMDREPGLDPDWAEPWYEGEDDGEFEQEKCEICGKPI